MFPNHQNLGTLLYIAQKMFAFRAVETFDLSAFSCDTKKIRKYCFADNCLRDAKSVICKARKVPIV
jgi:hypothetical protein